MTSMTFAEIRTSIAVIRMSTAVTTLSIAVNQNVHCDKNVSCCDNAVSSVIIMSLAQNVIGATRMSIVNCCNKNVKCFDTY